MGDRANSLKKTDYTLEDFKPYFSMPLADAAKKLGMSFSHLKNLCRKIELENWPYRKLTSLQKSITALEEKCQNKCSAAVSDGAMASKKPKQQCSHRDKIAHLRGLVQKVIDNPNEVKEIVAPGSNPHSASSVSASGGAGVRVHDDGLLSKDPFIRHLQTKGRSSGSKRKRSGYTPSRPLPSLAEFFDELVREDSMQAQRQGLGVGGGAGSGLPVSWFPPPSRGSELPGATNLTLGLADPPPVPVLPFKNVLRPGWYFDDKETADDDGGLEYPGTTAAPVVEDEDPLGRARRRKFAPPVELAELVWAGGSRPEIIMMEPRAVDMQGRVVIVPTFCSGPRLK